MNTATPGRSVLLTRKERRIRGKGIRKGERWVM
jgi:hypothetical protein